MLGHQRGDQLLQEVADALTDAVRVHDIVVRQGGDEFAVIAPETNVEDDAAARRPPARRGSRRWPPEAPDRSLDRLLPLPRGRRCARGPAQRRRRAAPRLRRERGRPRPDGGSSPSRSSDRAVAISPAQASSFAFICSYSASVTLPLSWSSARLASSSTFEVPAVSLDVFVEVLLVLGLLLERAFTHAAAAGDQIDEHGEERDEDQERRPRPPCPNRTSRGRGRGRTGR